jgi:hypothetical protein
VGATFPVRCSFSMPLISIETHDSTSYTGSENAKDTALPGKCFALFFTSL